jgi:quinol monooxygenase YgiN
VFGLQGRIVAQPGQADALAALLVESAALLGDDDGCLLYVVSRSDEPDSIWVTEVWADRAAHDASLEDDRVRAIIARARPLVASFADRVELRPLGGKGL